MSASHHIRKADAWSRRGIGLGGGSMAALRRQKCAQVDFKSQGGGYSQSQNNVSNYQEVPRRCICFHGCTVVLQCLKALIEKIYQFIDANDGCRRTRTWDIIIGWHLSFRG